MRHLRAVVCIVLLAGCGSPQTRSPVITSSGIEGFAVARFDVRGCLTEALVDAYNAEPKKTLIFGQPIPTPAEERLGPEVLEIRRRVWNETGGEGMWRRPAALEFDPEHREILVRQRCELLPAIERAIDELRRERAR